MYTYIVYDGRANYDEDRASVLEVIGEMSKKAAIKAFKRDWSDHDAVLFEYDSNEKQLINGRNILSIY